MVFLQTVARTELHESLTYPARVVPKVSTTILSEADGLVSRVQAPLGNPVRRGQAILTLRHTDPIYQYAPLAVTAPVSGVVSGLDVTEGSQVIRGQKLATVTDPAQSRLQVEIPAQDLPLVSRGMVGEFRVGGREGVAPVRVRGVSPFVDPATGTATCELELVRPRPGKEAKPVLYPGMLGQVSFKANVHQGVSIPDYAVIYRGTQPLVRVVEGGKAKQLPVKLGRKERGQVEVESGLAPGAQLVLRSSRYVADGEAVAVQAADPGKAGPQ